MGVAFGSINDKCAEFERIYTGKYDIRTYGPCFVAEIECDDMHLKEAFRALLAYIGEGCLPENVRGSPNQPPGQQVNADTAVRIPITLPIIRENDSLQCILPSEFTSVGEIPIPLNKDITLRSLPPRTVAVAVFHGHAPRATYMRYVAKLEAMLRADNLIGEPAAESAGEPAVEPDAERGGEEGEGEGGVQKIGAISPRPSSQPAPEPAAETTTAAPGPEPSAALAPVPVPAQDAAPAPPQPVHWSVARYHPHFTLPAFRRNEVWIHLNPDHPLVAARTQQHYYERNQQAVAAATAQEKVREAGTEGAAAPAGEKGEAPVAPASADASTSAASAAPAPGVPGAPAAAPEITPVPTVTSISAVKAEVQGDLRI